MFKIPAVPPDASNLAEGLVINSTLSIISAGIWSRVRVVGLPSINRVGVALRNVTLPSISTFREGIFFITSAAVWPVLVRFLSTVNIFRSIPNSSKGLLADVTVTAARVEESSINLMFPRSLSTIPIIC